MASLTVACVYRPGGGFSPEYVTRLQAGIAKHCATPHDFVCLTTESIPGVECEPLLRNNRGWWNKLELFRKGLFTGPTVYVDLDTIVVGDVTDIFTYPHKFTAGCNWKYFDMGERVMNSGFMAWNGRDLSHLDQDIDQRTHEEYSQDYRKWGDQAFVQERLGFEFEDIGGLFPGRYVSYKLHVRRQGKVPKSASIVAFHGRPRPHEVEWSLPE